MNADATSLQRLHDIVVPPPSPLWPPAPGMLILTALLLITLLTLLVRAFLLWQHNRYRREALRELAHAAQPATIATLLKRTALTAYPRNQVASLSGPAWHAFLNRTADTTAFSSDSGPLLDHVVCTNNPLTSEQTRTLTDAVRHWIKRHKTPAP